MVLTIDQIEKFMGQNIKDEYGRIVGKIVTAFTNAAGEIESVEIAINESEVEKVTANRLKLTPDGLIVVADWKVWALDVENKLDRVRRRIRAVEELYSKGMIPGHAYEEIKKKLEDQFKIVKDEVKKVKEELRKRVGQLEDKIIRLEKDMANLMVLYMSNEVSEVAYKLAIDYLRTSKMRNVDEKKDIEKHLEIIAKLESEVSEPKIRTPQEKPSEEVSSAPIQVQIVET
ncbi:MAG TPA: hypothetical protein ENG05_03280 [Acidilobales archaeon]|nr:hypothetical protein [Acidilobales archaeon]